MAVQKVTTDGERPEDHPRWPAFQKWAKVEGLDLTAERSWWEDWFHCFVNGIRLGSEEAIFGPDKRKK